MDAGEYRQQQQQSIAMLRDRGLPLTANARTFCEALAKRRGREIAIVEANLQEEMPGTYGLWLAYPSIDVIVVESETHRFHQNRIILHEAGHIVRGHEPDGTGQVDIPASVFRRLPANLVKQQLLLGMRRRSTCDTEAEREAEAEAFALMLEELGIPNSVDEYTDAYGL